MADDQADPGAAFAALMNNAATAAAPQDGAEPRYGWTTDPETGERRPKKAAGRPRKSPSIEELKEEAAQREAAQDAPPAGDRAPDARTGRGRRRSKDAKPEQPVEQFRAGPIAKGVNRLYRKGGRIVRAWDEEIGSALIEITKKDVLDDGTPDPDDITVGEAWEEIARTNPRIRRFLLKIIAGGAWGQLIMAHGPVLLAVLMKDSVRKHLPLHKLIAAFFSDDDEGPPRPDGTGETSPPGQPGSPGNGAGPLPGGLTKEDLMQLAGVADKLMAGGIPGSRRSAGMPRARPSVVPAAAESPPGE